MIPSYWEEAKKALSERDSVLSALIGQYPGIGLVRRADPFSTLARSIVGQQISVKAADSAWERLISAAGNVSPESILSCPELGNCGLSGRKVEYLMDLAIHFSERRLDGLEGMEDEAVISALTKIRGVGRWTAEMFLIFQALRPDILPLDDLGLQRAIRLHYNGGNTLDRRQMLALAEPWKPWRSVATWYLWRSLDPVPVEY